MDTKGFGDGAKQGGILGSLITLGTGAMVGGGVSAAGKLRDRSTAKRVINPDASDHVIGEETNPSEEPPVDKHHD